jgi:hypothetical protein
VSNVFREALTGITGTSWLDELSRASLRAAEAKFAADRGDDALLRVEFGGGSLIDARDSYLVTKAVQDATAKIGHIIRDPRSEAAGAHRADREKARLIQRGQAGSSIYFGFPEWQPRATPLEIPGLETLAHRAVRELVNVLPGSPEDDNALDAVIGQRRTVRNAVSDLVSVVTATSRGLSFELGRHGRQEVVSVLSTEQADALRDSLKETRTDTRQITITGRLDGVRTRRRIFYLEPDSGPDIHGALDLSLLDDIRENLGRRVVVRLQEERIETLSGKRTRPVYLLLAISPTDTELS